MLKDGRWPAQASFCPFQFLPPLLRPGARGLAWSGARAKAWRPAGRDGAVRGGAAGVKRARRAGGGVVGSGCRAGGATCGRGGAGSGRSTPPAARTAATGNKRNSSSTTPDSFRPAGSSSTLGMQQATPPNYTPLLTTTPQLRAHDAQERSPMAPQLHTAVPGGGQERRGAGLHSHLSWLPFL